MLAVIFYKADVQPDKATRSYKIKTYPKLRVMLDAFDMRSVNLFELLYCFRLKETCKSDIVRQVKDVAVALR